MSGRRNSGVFFANMVGFEVNFCEISQCWHVVIQSQRNIEVSIFVTCLNFAGYRVVNLLSPNEQWLIELSLIKNCIEFELVCKLPGTSLESEALVYTRPRWILAENPRSAGKILWWIGVLIASISKIANSTNCELHLCAKDITQSAYF